MLLDPGLTAGVLGGMEPVQGLYWSLTAAAGAVLV